MSACGPSQVVRYAAERAGGDTTARRVLRGGSWINDARNCRSANRNANDPGNRNDNIGFRLAPALCVSAPEEPQEAQPPVPMGASLSWQSGVAPVRQ